MNYQIILENAAQRDLSRIHGNIYTRICRAIDALANNPRPIGCIKLKMISLRSVPSHKPLFR